jgi:hypothetical protein
MATAATQLAIATAAATLLLLASLHVLSPELDPSWRMVSEYANGQHGWVLSLMFSAWALSSWAVVITLRSLAVTKAAKVGLVFLFLAGAGEAMASVFDIKHPLHSVAAMIGIPSLPVAAMLISASLARTREWSGAKSVLLWAANMTWVSFVLMAVSFAIFIATYKHAGGDMSAGVAITALPPGVIAWVGWANRLLIFCYCVWVITVAWQTLQRRGQSSWTATAG